MSDYEKETLTRPECIITIDVRLAFCTGWQRCQCTAAIGVLPENTIVSVLLEQLFYQKAVVSDNTASAATVVV